MPPNYDYDGNYYTYRNYEESRAITSTDVYTKGLVSWEVNDMQTESIKGLDITIKIPISNFDHLELNYGAHIIILQFQFGKKNIVICVILIQNVKQVMYISMF